MPTVTPSTFWNRYKRELRRCGTQEAYLSDPLWTPIAISAAKAACKGLGLQSSGEYFHVDVLGCKQTVDYDWTIRVAFEVENTARWKDELCKLSHIVADLCVLATYELHKKWTCKEALEDYMKQLGDRVCRVEGRRWLFIFGPDWRKPQEPRTAYTLDARRNLESVDTGRPLCGTDLPEK